MDRDFLCRAICFLMFAKEKQMKMHVTLFEAPLALTIGRSVCFFSQPSVLNKICTL